MPPQPTHTQKKRKNLVLLGILLGIVAGLFYLTILKMSGN